MPREFPLGLAPIGSGGFMSELKLRPPKAIFIAGRKARTGFKRNTRWRAKLASAVDTDWAPIYCRRCVDEEMI
jgi:hypothetical protein